MDVLLMLIENYVGDEGLTTLIAGLSDAHVYCLDVFLQSKFTFPNAPNEFFATKLTDNFPLRSTTANGNDQF